MIDENQTVAKMRRRLLLFYVVTHFKKIKVYFLKARGSDAAQPRLHASRGGRHGRAAASRQRGLTMLSKFVKALPNVIWPAAANLL